MNYWPINVALEKSITNYLQTVITGSEATIYNGENNLDKQAPCVIVWVASAHEIVPRSGMYECDTIVQTREMPYDMPTSGSTMGNLAADAFSIFFDPNYISNLNTNNPYSCSVVYTKQLDNKFEYREDCIINEMSFAIFASQI